MDSNISREVRSPGYLEDSNNRGFRCIKLHLPLRLLPREAFYLCSSPSGKVQLTSAHLQQKTSRQTNPHSLLDPATKILSFGDGARSLRYVKRFCQLGREPQFR